MANFSNYFPGAGESSLLDGGLAGLLQGLSLIIPPKQPKIDMPTFAKTNGVADAALAAELKAEDLSLTLRRVEREKRARASEEKIFYTLSNSQVKYGEATVDTLINETYGNAAEDARMDELNSERRKVAARLSVFMGDVSMTNQMLSYNTRVDDVSLGFLRDGFIRGGIAQRLSNGGRSVSSNMMKTVKPGSMNIFSQEPTATNEANESNEEQPYE